MNALLAEFIGTAFIILLGDGVVANVLLQKTKGHNGGLIVIAFGWAIAVFGAVYISAPYSGAHLNPAVTIALAFVGKFEWSLVAPYMLAQLAGGFAGAILVWLTYQQHFTATDNADAKLAVFCTSPAIRNPFNNLLTEIIATFAFILGVLYIVAPASSLGALDALPVALLVLGIGLSLGGPTGYAINPARDLGPRIAHFILPIGIKRDSDWSYSWIPVAGPLIGAILAAIAFKLL
jgi:glycerol uptake facilitator protein